MTEPTPRAQARARTERRIVELAADQLATVGAAGLSLRAIARELGLVSSAVYRYFPSRDALLTRLLIEAYTDLGSAAAAAEAACDRGDLRGRLGAVLLTIRDWSRREPHRFALLYGTPVPGYDAPRDTVDPASIIPLLLVGIGADAAAAGMRARRTPALEAAAPGVAAVAAALGGRMDPEDLVPGLVTWTTALGAATLEQFGHYEGVIESRDAYWAFLVDEAGTRMGLPEAA